MPQKTPQPKIEGLDKLKNLRSSLQKSYEDINSLLAEVSEGLDDTPAAQRKKTLLGLEQALAELEKRANFVNLPNAERCRVLANRLEATETATDDPNLFKLHFNERFPIGLTCWLYFPPTDASAQEIETYLRRDEMAFQMVIILSLDPAQQMALRPYGEEATTLWVVPNFNELAALLLSEEPIAVFITRLATQLQISLISPYQTNGAVQSDLMFFGRTQQLAHILGRTPTNYLLIGGRQLGKSSLLKYIERHYQDDPKVDCHYMVLSSHNLQSRLAEVLNLPVDTELSVLLENLVNVPDGQRRLLLIDEADSFIHDEMEKGYPTLKHFRSLSGEGRCHFIFAGFWNLYKATFLDFLAPIRNFGEPVFVGELEPEACQQLATKPMEMLGIRYASNELVEQILEQTGQQANLIATVCDQMLKKLAIGQRTLAQENVTQALQSREIKELLKGYAGLTREKQAARLDRLIIYTTADKRVVSQKSVKSLSGVLPNLWSRGKGFTLAEVMDKLDQCDCTYNAEQLKQSLARLELAFIIRREGKYYRYCVPLFQQMLKEQGLAALLRAEGVIFQ